MSNTTRKLRALKEAMEGRGSTEPAAPAQVLAMALRQCPGSAQQRQRLLTVVAALAQAPVGALGIALPRA